LSKEASLTTLFRREDFADFVFGDVFYLSGIIFTARDMAHIAREKVV